MPYCVILQPGAEIDIDNAYQWYEAQRIGLGEQFLVELVRYYHKLEQNPFMFKVIINEYRQASLQRFPYVIVYRIVHSDIHIYALFHTSRNPARKLPKH